MKQIKVKNILNRQSKYFSNCPESYHWLYRNPGYCEIKNRNALYDAHNYYYQKYLKVDKVAYAKRRCDTMTIKCNYLYHRYEKDLLYRLKPLIEELSKFFSNVNTQYAAIGWIYLEGSKVKININTGNLVLEASDYSQKSFVINKNLFVEDYAKKIASIYSFQTTTEGYFGNVRVDNDLDFIFQIYKKYQLIRTFSDYQYDFDEDLYLLRRLRKKLNIVAINFDGWDDYNRILKHYKRSKKLTEVNCNLWKVTYDDIENYVRDEFGRELDDPDDIEQAFYALTA